MVGALVYTSPTHLVFAVEGEVYAFSSMLTALVFWLILKWEDNAEKPHSDKWLVLIAYIMGLSIGVHLLNLLCIPAIVLVHYFKKNENPTWKGGILALLGSSLLIIVLMWGIIPGFTKVGGWFELFFVNTLGMPYNSGLFVYLILLVASIAWTLFETISGKGKESRARLAFYLSIALAGILFIGDKLLLWIGTSLVELTSHSNSKNWISSLIKLGYNMSVCHFGRFFGLCTNSIRSSANTPLDLNSPEDIFSLGSYLNANNMVKHH